MKALFTTIAIFIAAIIFIISLPARMITDISDFLIEKIRWTGEKLT